MAILCFTLQDFVMFWVFCHLSSSHFSVLLISLSASSLCLFSHHFVSLPVHLNPSLHSLSVRLFWIPHLSPVFLVFHVSLPPCSKCVFGLYLIYLFIYLFSNCYSVALWLAPVGFLCFSLLALLDFGLSALSHLKPAHHEWKTVGKSDTELSTII